MSLTSFPATLPLAQVDILVVDDNPKNVLAIEAMLGALGQSIVCAESGTEALRALLDHDFALVLLDIQMAGLDGFQTAQIIRARDRSRHLPIIFMTAFASDEVQTSQWAESPQAKRHAATKASQSRLIPSGADG